MDKILNRIQIILFLISTVFSYLYTTSQISDVLSDNSQHESGAKIALNFINRMRAYPNNDIPKAKFMEEYKKNKNSLIHNISIF